MAGDRLRAQEHDFINTGEGDVRVIDQRANVIGRDINKRRVVADFRDYGVMDDSTAQRIDFMLNLAVSPVAARGILVIPEFDLKPDGIVWRALKRALLERDRLRLHPILRPPGAHRDEQRKQLAPRPAAIRHSPAVPVSLPEA